MGSEGWISDLRREASFADVAKALGMQEGSRKRWKPCPACKADHTSHDARPCVTVGAAGGWKCWACNAKGDAVTLICYALAGGDSPSSEGWDEVRQFAVSQGWIRDQGPPARGRVRTLGKALVQSGAVRSDAARRDAAPADPVMSPEETPEERAVNTRGLFRWTDDLPDRCARAYADPASMGWTEAEQAIAKQVARYLIEYRQITDDVLLDAKIGLYVDEQGHLVLQEGRPIITIPLPDRAGRFVNIHFRRVPVSGTCDACDALGPWKECDTCRKGKRYRLCPGRPTPLYGADRLTPGKGQSARIIEGEFDVLALRSYGMGENTVSGTTGASSFADDWLDALEPFESIYLCYDDDKAGRDGAAVLAGKLGHYRCARVTFPKKDAGDCRIAGVPVEAIERAFKVADSYIDVKLRRANEFAQALNTLLEHPEQLKGVSTGSAKLDDAIGGWANGLVVVTGESGMGKTTLTTWALWKLAQLGHTVAITSFEQQPIMTVLQLLSMELQGDPTKRSKEDREAALERLSELPLYIVDHYGQMPWTKLEEAIKYAVRRCGVRYVLIDHLGFLVDPDADDERRAIQAVIRSMVLLRKDMDVTMFLIVHPRNDPDASKKFGRVTMQHLKGASAIRQDADLVLVVTRELPNTEKGRTLSKARRRPWPQTRIYIDKKRGRFGSVSGAGEVVLAYDPDSQTFADTWDQTPMGRSGQLIDTVPEGTSDEGEEPSSSRSGKTGARKGGRGRGRQKQEAGF